MEAVMRTKLAEGSAFFHADALQNLEVAARGIQLDKADLIDGFDESHRAAVHDRNFGAVDFDDGVVDAEAAQSGEQMLDGGDGSAVAVADDRTKGHAGDVAVIALNLRAVGLAICEMKAETGIAVGRTQDDGDWRSRVDTRACYRDFTGKRSLPCPYKSLHGPQAVFLVSLSVRGWYPEPPVDPVKRPVKLRLFCFRASTYEEP